MSASRFKWKFVKTELERHLFNLHIPEHVNMKTFNIIYHRRVLTVRTRFSTWASVFLNVGPQAHKWACGFLKRAWSFHWAYSGPQGKFMAEIQYFIC